MTTDEILKHAAAAVPELAKRMASAHAAYVEAAQKGRDAARKASPALALARQRLALARGARPFVERLRALLRDLDETEKADAVAAPATLTSKETPS